MIAIFVTEYVRTTGANNRRVKSTNSIAEVLNMKMWLEMWMKIMRKTMKEMTKYLTKHKK